eukprot:225375-Prorocentrum_lima.AAC.1
MTSSLVGSEMCIRDRFTSDESLLRSGGEQEAARRPLRPLRAVVLEVGTVSYTHLTLPTICSV